MPLLVTLTNVLDVDGAVKRVRVLSEHGMTKPTSVLT